MLFCLLHFFIATEVDHQMVSDLSWNLINIIQSNTYLLIYSSVCFWLPTFKQSSQFIPKKHGSCLRKTFLKTILFNCYILRMCHFCCIQAKIIKNWIWNPIQHFQHFFWVISFFCGILIVINLMGDWNHSRIIPFESQTCRAFLRYLFKAIFEYLCK